MSVLRFFVAAATLLCLGCGQTAPSTPPSADGVTPITDAVGHGDTGSSDGGAGGVDGSTGPADVPGDGLGPAVDVAQPDAVQLDGASEADGDADGAGPLPDVTADASVDAEPTPGDAGQDTQPVADATVTPDSGADAADSAVADVQQDAAVGDAAADAPQDAAAEDASPQEPVAAMALDGPNVMAMEACAALALSPLEGAVFEPLDVALNLIGDGAIFADPQCTEALDGVTLGMEQAETFYVEAGMTPSWITVTASAAGVTPATWELLVSDAERFHPDDYASRALVIYNENFPGADEIADHYVAARGLDPAQVCAVQLPTGQFGTPWDIRGVRRAILSDCLCPLIPEADRPDPCDWSAHGDVMTLTAISHLVLIKGLPARLYGTEWANGNEEPSFAHYLSMMLANDGDFFTESTTGGNSADAPTRTPFDYPPDIAPSVHKRFAYGTVEAMTVARTKALIDRTLQAEAAGLRGNVLTEREQGPVDIVPRLTFDFDDACWDYMTHTPYVFGAEASSWPHTLCRWGCNECNETTLQGCLSGRVPGSLDGLIPHAINVGLFLGDDPRTSAPTNKHAGFDTFETLLNWRRETADCTPLCRDLQTEAEQAACAEASTDYFKELNTDCVGGGPGFMGQQIRSYPVQYYGFVPALWSHYGAGDREKTVPTVVTEGGFQDETFSDTRYAHFGTASVDQLDTSTCVDEVGDVYDCRERIAVNLLKTGITVDPPMVLKATGADGFTVRVRYRNQASPNAKVSVRMCATDSCHWADVFYLGTYDEGSGLHDDIPQFDLTDEHLDWTTAEFVVSADAGPKFEFASYPGGVTSVPLAAGTWHYQGFEVEEHSHLGTLRVGLWHDPDAATGDCAPTLELLSLGADGVFANGDVLRTVTLSPEEVSSAPGEATLFALDSSVPLTTGGSYAIALSATGACVVGLGAEDPTLGPYWDGAGPLAATLQLQAYHPIRRLYFWLDAPVYRDVRGFLDIDGIEVIRQDDGAPLVPPELGSFAEPYLSQTRAGDYASNAIDRLGAIAFWGSSSHFNNGGWAFSNPSLGGDFGTRETLNALLAGRSLGTALAFPSASTGLFYGDPLYRPVSAHIHNAANTTIGKHYTPHELWSDSPTDDEWLFVNAMHGTDTLRTVRWTLSACETDGTQVCHTGTAYGPTVRGVGALRDHAVNVFDVIDPSVSFTGALRLKVDHPDHPDQHLNYFVYLHYYNYPQPECPWDVDGDGGVDVHDVNLVIPYRPCSEAMLVGDLDDDGDVDVDDFTIIVEWMATQNLEGDLDEDGDVDYDDVGVLALWICGLEDPPPVEGADVDGDGVITDDDVQAIYDNYGDCPV